MCTSIPAWLGIILFALTIHGEETPGSQEGSSPPPHHQAPPRTRPIGPSRPAPGGLNNFAVVDDHLLRGAQPSVQAIKTLKSLGVTVIVDLIPPDDQRKAEIAAAASNGILYTNIPMKAVGRPTVEQVDAALSVIANTPGRVFVHCQGGRDRTGTIVACYRLAKYRWTSERALQEAKDYDMTSNAAEMKEFVFELGKSVPHPTGQ